MRLIGMYPFYDESREFENYNFIIDDLSEIDKALSSLKYGNEIPNTSTRNELNIRLLDGEDIIKTWSINPKRSYVRIHGHTFKFEIDPLIKLSSKYGFKYRFENIIFKSKKEYFDYFNEHKQREKYLFSYEPDFKMEGEFELEFKKTKSLNSPNKAFTFISKKLKGYKIFEDYRAGYEISEKNKTQKNQYTITITTRKEIYDNVDFSPSVKGKWLPKKIESRFFYRN